jgi:DNA-binding response OmpR family regulator
MYIVLVVEDEPLIGLDYTEVLSLALAVRVVMATSVETAEPLLDLDLDFALLDVDLRTSTSFGIARLLGAKMVPCAFVTGSARSCIPYDLREVPFLPKPCMAKALINAVQEGIDHRTAGRLSH